MKIIIEGKPEPQLRPRISGNRMYDPKKTSDYKKYVRLSARQQYKGEPLKKALTVEMDIYREIPKSTSNKRRLMKNEKAIRPIVKPDVDNYTKGILDALNGIIYKDDSQVVDLTARKYYSDNPRVEVEIIEVERNNNMAKEYALYKGDEHIAYGTPKELAERLGIKPETI